MNEFTYGGTDLGQIIRHFRLKELLLVQIPQWTMPLEGVITNITNDGEYAKISLPGGAGGYWARVSELEVLAILSTPSEIRKTGQTAREAVAKWPLPDAAKGTGGSGTSYGNDGEWMNNE